MFSKIFNKQTVSTNKTVVFANECREGMNGYIKVSGFNNVNGRRYTNEQVPFCIVGQLGKPALTPALLNQIWEAAAEVGLTVHECIEVFDNPAHHPETVVEDVEAALSPAATM